MQSAPLEFIDARFEATNAVLEWVRVTEEFHSYYVQIGEVLKGLSFNAHPGSTIAASTQGSHRLKNLHALQKHMNDVLATLLFDVSKPKRPTKGNTTSSSNELKLNQLLAHAELIGEINKKARKELLQLTNSYA
jgi:hypothetical protein